MYIYIQIVRFECAYANRFSVSWTESQFNERKRKLCPTVNQRDLIVNLDTCWINVGQYLVSKTIGGFPVVVYVRLLFCFDADKSVRGSKPAEFIML